MRALRVVMKVITGIDPDRDDHDKKSQQAIIAKDVSTKRVIGEANSLTDQLNSAIADLRSLAHEHHR